MKVGERLYNLKRLFNVRRGISRKDDVLPMRLLTQRRGEGGTPKELPNFGTMLADYYAYRGWDSEGIPTKEKLGELGLSEYLPEN
jgi:aldehyde:ferredoxin oxidoreductase